MKKLVKPSKVSNKNAQLYDNEGCNVNRKCKAGASSVAVNVLC